MLPLLALGLTACSFSFKAGSQSSTKAGKPATQSPADEGTAPASKPIADAPTEAEAQSVEAEAAEPAGTEPDPGPTRTRPVVGTVTPNVEPRLTAVCRVEDESLSDLCHVALDPIAADDFAAWETQLADGVTLTRPSYQKGMQRIEGPAEVRKLSEDLGGLRTLMHLGASDRVVGTLHSDCRTCRRSFVAFETNSRSGTIVVTVDMTTPPRVSMVEVGSRVGRRHLGEHLRKRTRGGPTGGPTTLEAPKEPNKEPTAAPEPEAKPKTSLRAR
ncbi:MAG: hypothetical protein AAGF11_13385 [Myxococcota bacterium]